jgi:hypothetical protein
MLITNCECKIKIMRNCILLLPFILLLASCGEKSTSKGKPYFDIEGFFNNETIQLKKDSAYFMKSLDSDGKTDEVSNKNPDWKVELQLFNEADINKAAFIGKMQVDTLRDNTDTTRHSYTIVYTPKDKNIKVKELRISFNRNHDVKEIDAHIESSSAMNSIVNDLRYIPGKYYEIYSKEHTAIIGDSYYRVRGNILTEEKYFQ